jgi:serine/threonine protein kinase
VVPARIGRYAVVAHLATGGMGQVFLARSSGLGGFVRHVVLKTLDLPGTDEDEATAMFLDEARLLGLLHHQHITPVYEVGRDDDGHLFLVMDYVHGRTAHDVWQRTNQLGAALPLDFSLTVAAAAAAGLHYAHTRRDAEGRSLRIVHRDVSLSNLMIGFDGAVKLIDFGIAKAANRSTQTQAGYIKGKLGYMAPEQLRGHAVDARTDVFALGIVLYELTTMRRAFRDESDQVTMERIRAGAFTPPRQMNPAYPPELERIVTRALRVDPRERYPDADTMRRELDLLGHQLGLVLGDAAVVEVTAQLFEQRLEPWERPRAARPLTELDVPLEILPHAGGEDDSTRRTEPQLTLRAATEVAESQLETPPHGLPKRPSSFSIEGGVKRDLPNDTDGVTIVPSSRAVTAAAHAARDHDPESVPTVEVPPAVMVRVAAESVVVGSSAPGRPAVDRSPEAFARTRADLRRRVDAKLPTAPRRAAGSRRTLVVLGWIFASLLAAGAAATGVYLLGRSGGPAQANAPAGEGDGGPRKVTMPLAPPPVEDLEDLDDDPPEPALPPGAARPAPPGPAAPIVLPPGAKLRLTVKSTPTGATVVLGGKRLGRTPFSGMVEAAPGKHTLKLRRKGYVPVSLEIELTGDLSREITLQPTSSR